MAKSKIIRVLRNVVGVLLVVIGLILGPVPVVPGFLVVIPGIALIDLPVKRRAHVWLRQRARCYRALALGYLRALRNVRQRRHDRR